MNILINFAAMLLDNRQNVNNGIMRQYYGNVLYAEAKSEFDESVLLTTEVYFRLK